MNIDLRKKAESLLELHHSGKLLILPNIWDVLGAKLLESEGFKAIATASASVAFSNGFNDGQEIKFESLLRILKPICDCTYLPVSADIERGYADSINELGENITQLINLGIAGINIEDSKAEKNELESIDKQCGKIKHIRNVSAKLGVPLVINARTDVFLLDDFDGDKLTEAIKRGSDYKDAGADCFYPVLCDNDQLTAINSKVDLPLNVYAQKNTLPMLELERSGIARLSLGPSLLKSALTEMRNVIRGLKNYENYDSFTGSGIMSGNDIMNIIKQ